MSIRDPKISFKQPAPFRRALNKRIQEYFKTEGKSRRDVPQMYLKTFMIMLWLWSSYALLVFGPGGTLLTIAMVISLGMATAGVGFSIMHDGNHKGYSQNRVVNALGAYTLDMLGASSYVWSHKHNKIHHSHTNIDGVDTDIDLGFLGRMTPEQPRMAMHRFQHIYLWFLYSFLSVKWVYFDDFKDVIRGRVGQVTMPRPKGKNLLVFLGGKALHVTIALVIPMMFHDWTLVLGLYMAILAVQGVVMATVFQLAHCVEGVSTANVEEQETYIDKEWAVWQIETTADFAPNNWFVTWYVGGLNYQVVHHLYPSICHIHYPALSKILAEVCEEHGVKYQIHPTFTAALFSHVRWLRRMGHPSTVQTSQPQLAT